MKLSSSFQHVVFVAYEMAWRNFVSWPSLSRDLRQSGPRRLLEDIQAQVDAGGRDPDKVATQAVSRLREFEQILQSRARAEERMLQAAE